MSVLVSLKFHIQAQELTHPLASLSGSGSLLMGEEGTQVGSSCLYHTCVSLFSLLMMRKVGGKFFVS